MKENVLHIVRGNPYSIREGLAQKGIQANIVSFPSFFECGYLPKDLSEKELSFHLQSLRLRPDDFRRVFNELKVFISEDYSKYNKVVIWHGNHANELLMLYFICSFINARLYHVDITSVQVYGCDGLNSISINDLSPNNVAQEDWFNDVMKPISENEKQEYKELWNQWVNTEEGFRRYNKLLGNIERLPYNFMDEDIYTLLQNETMLSLIVAKLHCKFDDFGDKVIRDRVIEYWSFIHYHEELYAYLCLKPRD